MESLESQQRQLTYANYPFLKELGLSEAGPDPDSEMNNGCYRNGEWVESKVVLWSEMEAKLLTSLNMNPQAS